MKQKLNALANVKGFRYFLNSDSVGSLLTKGHL